jgi:hypothetical protein
MPHHKEQEGSVSSHVVTSNTEAAILARVIASDTTAITPAVARYQAAVGPASFQYRHLSGPCLSSCISCGPTSE